MKNKSVFSIAVISLVIFIGIATYLWYLYFHDYESKLMTENCKTEFANAVQLINTGNVNYVNASIEDTDSIIPVYYFSVKNASEQDYEYNIVIEDSEGTDGCTKETRLKWDELEYELKLDNKTIKRAGLDTLTNNILDTNTIKGKSVKDYSLKIRLKSEDTDYNDKHFHYVVNIKEKK